jgi:isoquinoline 1-oxidoreductase beta subunit
MNCTADVRDGECEIWVPTQAPHSAQQDAMKLLKLPVENVKVNVTLLGGGFGRRLFTDYVPEAVEISRAVKAPVQVIWTRSDDMKFGYFQPASVNRIHVGLDDRGNVTSWIHKVAGSDLSVYAASDDRSNPNRYADDGSPWGAFDNFYNLPNLKVDYVPVDSPVPTGPWRAVEYPATVFARECFLDEIAHQLGKDPLAYRIELLAPFDDITIGEGTIQRARTRAVLEVAAQRSGWKTPPGTKDGRRWGRGVACNVYHAGTHMAQVAEVSVGREGDVRVHRIVCAVDCRTTINPLGVEGQVESAITWGLSSLLGEITFKNGQAQESSYRDFHVVRYNDAPVIETHIVESGGAPAGLGEQPVPPVVPAVLNAVFAATGKRLRRIPIGTGVRG